MGGRNTRTRVSEPIHGFAGRLKSIQRGTIALPGFVATANASITAVVLANAYELSVGRSQTGNVAHTTAPYLTSTTNVQVAEMNGVTGGFLSFVVVEEY